MTRHVLVALLAVVSGFAVGCQAPQVANSDEASAADGLRSCGSGVRTPGMDVSSLDGKLSWSSMAKAGMKFAFMRAGDGETADSRFSANWAGSAAVGMYRGAYHFFRPSEDPIVQADLFLDQVGTLGGDHDLPPVLDMEVTGGENATTITAHALVWLERVEAALGVQPVIYTGPGYQRELANPTSLATYPLWVANWTTACPSLPTRWKTWTFWQKGVGHGSTSAVAGLDLDEFAGSIDDLAAMTAAQQQ